MTLRVAEGRRRVGPVWAMPLDSGGTVLGTATASGVFAR